MRVVNPSSDLESVEKCIQLVCYDFIYTAVGLHPMKKSFSGKVERRKRPGISCRHGELGRLSYDLSPEMCRRVLPLISSLQKS